MKRLTPYGSEGEELLARLCANTYAAYQFVRLSGAGRPPSGSPGSSGVATPVPWQRQKVGEIVGVWALPLFWRRHAAKTAAT
jgi:hypothetical protein